MRLLIQRVRYSRLSISSALFSEIGSGLMVLVGVEQGDAEADADWLAEKTAGLRIFADPDGLMNLSVADTGGDVMAVSQFTLLASTKKGKRPSFIHAAAPEEAESLYEYFCQALEARLGKPVARGCFGADMQIELLNDGPVTIFIDSRRRE